MHNFALKYFSGALCHRTPCPKKMDNEKPGMSFTMRSVPIGPKPLPITGPHKTCCVPSYLGLRIHDSIKSMKELISGLNPLLKLAK